MRVGVYLGDIVPNQGGGYTFQDEIYQTLARLCSESHHDFMVFAHQSERAPAAGDLPHLFFRDPAPPGLVRRAISKLISYGRPVITPTPLDRLIAEHAVDFMWFVSQQVRPVQIPYLATIWDLQHRLQPWFPEVSAGGRWRQRELYFAPMLQRAAVVIAGTEAGRAEIVRFYGIPPERVRLLPHPTPDFALNAAANSQRDKEILTRFGLAPDYLLYPARFWSHKNHAGLLYAVRLLRDQYGLTLPVVLVGADGGNQPYIEQLIDRLGLREQVRILGFVSREELVALYHTALALVYLTFFGPENLPPLEAFALGCPVIASRVPGSEEQLGDAALLVDPTDDEGIAQAIKSVFESHTLRQTLIERGKQRAARWTGADFVRGIFAILNDFERVRRCWGNDQS